MKDTVTYLDYKDKKYPMIFTLNVMEEIQDKYETLDKWMELLQNNEPNIKALKFGLHSMINEGIEIENETNDNKLEAVDLKFVGRIITELGLKETAKKIGESVVTASKVDDEAKNE